MRKPRVIIFDDEVFILNMLRDFFYLRGYEVLSYDDPTTICPIYGVGGDVCTNRYPCSDVMLTDFNMPGVNGVELIEFQARKGCTMPIRNKAVISGYIDAWNRRRVRELGCHFFHKPFTLSALSEWLNECEQRTDLHIPLATRRREKRYESCREVNFRLPSSDRVYSGVAVNMSVSGLCLKVPAALEREQTIDLLPSAFHSCRSACVRWTRRIDDGAYLTGLQCR